jgi:predicted solute-binding protein
MAQAVLDAYFSSLHKTPHQSVAAALRAAAVQLTSAKASDQLRAIAAELETSTSENR